MEKISDNSYLKILDFSQLFIADAPMKRKLKILLYPPADPFWDTQYKNILNLFASIKKNFLQTLVEIIFRFQYFPFRVLGLPPPTNK